MATESPRWTIIPASDETEGNRGNFKWDPGELWTNDHELFRSQLSREDVPSASGEATHSGLSGSLVLSSPLIQFNVQISWTVCPLGTCLGKAQTLSPAYIWDVCYLEVRWTSKTPWSKVPWKMISTFLGAPWQTCRQLWFWLLIFGWFHFFFLGLHFH